MFGGGRDRFLYTVEGTDSGKCGGVEVDRVGGGGGGGRCGKCGGGEVGQIAAVGHDERQFAGGQSGRNELNAAHVDAAAVVIEVLRGDWLQRLG